MRTPIFRLPESFDPAEFLNTPKLQKHMDEARYFISLILTKLAYRDVDSCDRVLLHSAFLRKIMSCRASKPVIDALLEGGAVIRAPYQVGERSFGYTLNERYIQDRYVNVKPENPRLIARIQKWQNEAGRNRLKRMKPIHHALQKMQQELRIDGNQGREILAQLPAKSNPFDIQGLLIGDIERRNYRINVGNYGRVSNNITSMKREVRRALRARSNEKLLSVDISCCQPALLGMLILRNATHKEGRGGKEERERDQTRDQREREQTSIYDAHSLAHIGPETKKFCRLAQQGKLYDHLLVELNCGKIDKDWVKKKFLSDIIAKRKTNRFGCEYPSDLEACFRRSFPCVYRFIRKFNKDGWEHANLIRELQRQESSLVIETVAANLVNSHPGVFLMTLHDAIFTTEEYIPIVVQAFEDAFEQNDYPMSWKVSD